MQNSMYGTATCVAALEAREVHLPQYNIIIYINNDINGTIPCVAELEAREVHLAQDRRLQVRPVQHHPLQLRPHLIAFAHDY